MQYMKKSNLFRKQEYYELCRNSQYFQDLTSTGPHGGTYEAYRSEKPQAAYRDIPYYFQNKQGRYDDRRMIFREKCPPPKKRRGIFCVHISGKLEYNVQICSDSEV